MELNLSKGMSLEEARREALRGFGGVEQTKELYRDQRGLPMIETIFQDLRFGLRLLRRSPGFSILAVLCLTLGIGANAAVFSWIEGIYFVPIPQSLIRSDCSLLQARLAAKLTGFLFPGPISWICRGTARSLTHFSSAKLRVQPSASVTVPRSQQAASYRRTILMPSASIRFSAAGSSPPKLRPQRPPRHSNQLPAMAATIQR